MTSDAAKNILDTSTLRILAIETSTEVCSIGLSVCGKATVVENRAKQNHSEHVLPMIDNLLGTNELSVGDIDLIGFGAGPGSFTGVRLACSVAQGLAFGIDIPVVPVPSLEALAHRTKREKVLVCQDARMNQVYATAFERRGVACGSGFVSYKEVFETSTKFSIPILNDEYTRPTAREVIHIAAREFANGNAVAAEDAMPTYIRNKVALTLDEQASNQ